MINKLAVIIKSLKVPKVKKILLYEIKFLVPNYSCLQNPWLGGYHPQITVLSVLCPQLNLLNPPNKIPEYATEMHCIKVKTNKIILKIIIFLGLPTDQSLVVTLIYCSQLHMRNDTVSNERQSGLHALKALTPSSKLQYTTSSQTYQMHTNANLNTKSRCGRVWMLQKCGLFCFYRLI